jgi:hypothetical protein
MHLERALAQHVKWRSAVLRLDERSIGMALTACSQLMLEYWETRYPHDEKLAEVVTAMNEWGRVGSPETQSRVLDSIKRVAVEQRGYLSPVDPLPYRHRYPGDHAGDAIVAAANAISEIGCDDFGFCARSSFDGAVRTVAETLGHRHPEDDATNFLAVAKEKVRRAILARLSFGLDGPILTGVDAVASAAPSPGACSARRPQ